MMRSTSTCQGAVTNAMSAMITKKLNSERATIIFRPKRSASLAQTGAIAAVIAGVTPRQTPDQTATADVSLTPSWPKYRGRKGITSVKPANPMNVAVVTAAWLRRQSRFGRGPSSRRTPSRRSLAGAASPRSAPPARSCPRSPRSEPDSEIVIRAADVDGVNETDQMRIALHDDRAGTDAMTEEPDTAHESAVRDARGDKRHRVAACQVAG